MTTLIDTLTPTELLIVGLLLAFMGAMVGLVAGHIMHASVVKVARLPKERR